MSFFNPNSFDPYDNRLYDQEPVNMEERAGSEPAPEELPESLIEANEPSVNPIESALSGFTNRYAGGNNLTMQPTEQQQATELSQKLVQVDSLLKAIVIDPTMNTASDSFTDRHILALKKSIQATLYYCELLKDDLIKPKPTA